MPLLIKNGLLVDPEKLTMEKRDLLINENGDVERVEPSIECDGAEVIDASGCCVAPGLVDIHVHFRDPGFTYKESIETGALAAAKGGVTTVTCMPNTNPVIDTPELINYVQEKSDAACGVHVLPIGAVTRGQKGQELTDACALKEAGAVALSDDGVPIQNAMLMYEALKKAKTLGLNILAHSEDNDMVGNKAMNEGKVSEQLGMPGRPAIAEEYMIMRDAMLAEDLDAEVHICHVSTAKSVDIVRRMKARGVKITCETCPQYFIFTEDEILKQGTMARVNPPLRTPADVEGIIEGLLDGSIDAIATDHAPHSEEEKARGLETAPSGMVGLETSLAATLTAMYHTGKMTIPEIIRKMTVAPAQIVHIDKGTLEVGKKADVVIFDPEEKWVVDTAKFASKGRNTVFGGMELTGRVKYTLADGKVIYKD